MIRRILIISLLINASSIISMLFGQKEFKPEWNIGVGFGPTISSVDFRNQRGTSVSTKSDIQYHGGIAVRYINEKNLGLIAELNYSQQGWKEDFKDKPITTAKYTRTLNYLELPIMTHIYFGGKTRFFINLGPKLSFLINEKEDMNDDLRNYLASGNVNSLDITNQYYRKADKKVDYSILGGMGLEFHTGIGYFMLEGRYTFGLGDIFNNSKSDYFQRSANRVISARLTYYIKAF